MVKKAALQKFPIGVFDSGMGGLTVLGALKRLMPCEDFIYLGDTARLPYGTKSPETIKQYADQMVSVLVEQRIKALVLACNTATTAALSHLKERLQYMPVIGVVEPGAKAAIAASSKKQHISLLATETTVLSQDYQKIIKQHLPDVNMKANACGLLVALAEEGLTDHIITRETLRFYLSEVTKDELILLGCTHFPVFKKTIKKMFPTTIKIIDSAQATAEAVKKELTAKNLIRPKIGEGDVRYLVTDSIERFRRIGAIFLQHDLDNKPITLINTPFSLEPV